MVPAGLAALICAGFIAYLAFSKKTSPALKKASTIALVFIGLAFIACAILLLMTGSRVETKKGDADMFLAPVNEGRNIIPVLFAAIVVFLFLIIIIILNIREKRRK